MLVVVGGGLVGWGQLNQRVKAVEDQSGDVASITKVDHDTLIELRTEQRAMKEQLDKVDHKIDRLLEQFPHG